MRRGRPKSFDECEALDRAMNLFWQQGYEATGLSELEETMGISRQSLYDTFGSKRALFVRSIEHYRTTQLAQALALLERGGPHLENVKAAIRFFERLAADPRCRGCLVANALVEVAPHDPEIARMLHETLGLLEKSFRRTLREAQARGELSEEKSPQKLARALTNAAVGLVVSGKLPLGRSTLRDICTGTLSMLD